MPKQRTYPSCCISAFCGRIECTGCPNKHILEEFNRWVEENNAHCPDPIWSPLVYVSRDPKVSDLSDIKITTKLEPDIVCKSCKCFKSGTCDGLWFIGCTDYEEAKA